MNRGQNSLITPDQAQTLDGLFRQRIALQPSKIAYRQFDHGLEQWCDYSWQDMGRRVAGCQGQMSRIGLAKGDRVAVMASNCTEWVVFEQAALGLGLVVVPLFSNDRPDNVAYILGHADVKLLLIQGAEQWQGLRPLCEDKDLVMWSIENLADAKVTLWEQMDFEKSAELQSSRAEPDELATIVYTSGTTGKPKGVMLSHRNILWNAHSGLRAVSVYDTDSFLSFLPLSHTLERTIGYYLPMMCGAEVAYARSIPHLAEDLQTLKPTVLISVPRIYERVYNRIQESLTKPIARKLFNAAVNVGWARFEKSQGRGGWKPGMCLWPLLNTLVAGKIMAKLGGRLRIAICGGAPLPSTVGRTFVGLGLNLLQGYGMTESSPVISVNTFENNDPASVGPAMPDVEVKIGDKDELLARSPGVMLGYWKNEEATANTVDADGWLHTGDKAKLEGGRVYITGRLKDIIVLANGEKVPPSDMEDAILSDPLFEQVMVLGEGQPFLSALLVLNETVAQNEGLSTSPNTDELRHKILPRVSKTLAEFPGYAQVRRVAVVEEGWTVENGLLTPTLKLKRSPIMKRHQDKIEEIYKRINHHG